MWENAFYLVKSWCPNKKKYWNFVAAYNKSIQSEPLIQHTTSLLLIHYLPTCRDAGGWGLSQLTLGGRWGKPNNSVWKWTNTQKHIHTHMLIAGYVTWARGSFRFMENGFTWVRGGDVVARRGKSNEMKLFSSNTANRHKCALYLGWVEAALCPGPAVSVQGRILSRHSWHQKTS